MTDDQDESEEERLFPRAHCIAIAAELNGWTSVQAILAGARHIEGRSLPTDEIGSQLVMPMERGALFEAVFLRVIRWMYEGYAIPPAKIALARTLDPMITNETVERLHAARFRPTIKSAPLVAFDSSALPPPNGPNAFLVEDEPFMIEMLQAPLRCLMDILTFSYDSAELLYKLRIKAEATTGGAPTIYHRPYADSRLYATLEALCYYAFGLAIGPYSTGDGKSEIDISYRAVNVRSRSPVDVRLVDLARKLMEEMLHDLH